LSLTELRWLWKEFGAQLLGLKLPSRCKIQATTLGFLLSSELYHCYRVRKQWYAKTTPSIWIVGQKKTHRVKIDQKLMQGQIGDWTRDLLQMRFIYPKQEFYHWTIWPFQVAFPCKIIFCLNFFQTEKDMKSLLISCKHGVTFPILWYPIATL
jgi:hypothetical protein